MDYHITRADDWTRAQENEITKWEWQDLAHNDDELSSDPANGPSAFIYEGHPEEGAEAWLDWLQGQIYTSDPDEHLLAKMFRIAEALGARVLDNNNEVRGPAAAAELPPAE